MVRAYWNTPDETAKSFFDIDRRLWYKTGDIVRMDNDGCPFFQYRSVDVIKHKGCRVAAVRIETVPHENPAVIASYDVGISGKNLGEVIKAFVVLKEDVKGVPA